MPTPKTPKETAQETLPGVVQAKEQISTDKEAVEKLLNVQGHINELSKEAEKARALRLQMCGQFLESALTAAALPAPVTARLRKQFSGRLFEAGELSTAIEDSRSMVSELTAGAVVQGPRIHSVFDTADKLQAAADDLLGAPRDEAAKDLKVFNR